MLTVTETEMADGMVRFNVSIPPEGVEKLKQIQRLTGLKDMQDVIRFLLAMTAERVKDMGHTFSEEL